MHIDSSVVFRTLYLNKGKGRPTKMFLKGLLTPPPTFFSLRMIYMQRSRPRPQRLFRRRLWYIYIIQVYLMYSKFQNLPMKKNSKLVTFMIKLFGGMTCRHTLFMLIRNCIFLNHWHTVLILHCMLRPFIGLSCTD